MPDWSASMQQTFEYYVVDPNTWKDARLLTNVKSCTINRDLDAETLGSATIDITESVGECYIRVYLITIQNGIREKHPLGTFLVQTPSSTFNGRVRNVSMDAYTPLLELKENPPPLGYFVAKGTNVMKRAYQLTRENVRAPVVEPSCITTLTHDFVSDTTDTWLSFVSDLISNSKSAYIGSNPEPQYIFDLDEMGRILFAPKQDTASLQPIWTYDDGNSSILYPQLIMDHDLYGIPNVVEVVYSNGSTILSSTVENDDPNSPISTVSRGRKLTYRDTDPQLVGDPKQSQIDEYARQLLRDISSVEYTISYTHGYCPTRIGDCVRLDYARAGITNTKAKIVSQSIKCEPGCPVTEKAVFTAKLWG